MLYVWYFSRNSSPQAVLIAASRGAARGRSIRGVALPRSDSSARSARAPRASSAASEVETARDATRFSDVARLGPAEHLQQQAELERRFARRRASRRRPERGLGLLVAAARDQRPRAHGDDRRILRIELRGQRRNLVVAPSLMATLAAARPGGSLRDDCATADGIVSASITTAIESASAIIGRDGRSNRKKRIILARIIVPDPGCGPGVGRVSATVSRAAPDGPDARHLSLSLTRPS